MTDRELLEKAAKAAGYCVSFTLEMSMACSEGTYYTHDRGYPAANREGSHWWNPLLDDGDALRLAVKLGLTVDVRPLAVCIRRGRKRFSSFSMIEGESDLCGASRRAIVNAAAAIAQSR